MEAFAFVSVFTVLLILGCLLVEGSILAIIAGVALIGVAGILLAWVALVCLNPKAGLKTLRDAWRDADPKARR